MPTDDNSRLHNPHLWQMNWVRELLWVVLALTAVWVVYSFRGLLAPFFIAAALAYVVDPLVRAIHGRWGVPRVWTMILLLAAAVAALVAAVIWLLPPLIAQASELPERLPEYWETLRSRFASWSDGLSSGDGEGAPLDGAIDAQSLAGRAVDSAGLLLGLLGSVFGAASYTLVAAVLIPVMFVHFGAFYDRIHALEQVIPQSSRAFTLEIIGKIDQAFSAYVRGQLIVAVFTTTGFCVGFYVADVPYWFVVSLIGGTLSLIPYGQMSGWLLAIAFKYAESQTGEAGGFDAWSILVAPSLVYVVTQSMESWVITPFVQGETLNLHSVVVLVVLLIGGSIAGVVRLILAVPATASVRTILTDVVAPPLKRWAKAH